MNVSRLALALAMRAGILGSHDLADEQTGGSIVEPFRGVGTHAGPQLAATRTEFLGIGEIDFFAFSRQILGQRLAAVAFAFVGRNVDLGLAW